MAQDPDTTVHLVCRAREGDEVAFQTLVARNEGRLFLLVRCKGGRALRADCDVEDLCQEALLTAWRLLPEFEHRGPGSFFRWLSRVATNAINDRLRYLDAKGRNDVRHIESGATSSGGNPRGPLDPNPTAGSLAATREWATRVFAALRELEPELGAVVQLHVVEGLSMAEIAAAQRIGKTTVFDRLARGLAGLRDLLGPLD